MSNAALIIQHGLKHKHVHVFPQTSFRSVFAACLRYEVKAAAVGKTVFFSAYAKDKGTRLNENTAFQPHEVLIHFV